jgi:hypothetical protein
MISAKPVSSRRIRCRVFVALLIPVLLPLGAASAWSQVACKPFLSLKSVEERALSTQTVPWKWSATIVANIRHCATRSGYFEIDFVRVKENAPDLQFTERFRWHDEEFRISMELIQMRLFLNFGLVLSHHVYAVQSLT